MIKKTDYLKHTLKFGIIIVIFLFLVKILPSISHIRIKDITDVVEKNMEYALLIFLLIYALKGIIFVIPTAVITISAGIIFNPVEALIVNLIGVILELTTTFYFAQLLGKSFVHRFIKGKNFDEYLNAKKMNPKRIFILRLVPVFPVDVISAVLGVSRLSIFDYIIPSFIGLFPRVFCFSLIGDGIHNPLSPGFIIPVALTLVLTLVSQYFYERRSKGKLEGREGDIDI